jgi:hypothetical protein
MIKELVSGIGAALIFLILLVKGLFWWLSLALATSAYVGIRLLFPPEHQKVLAVLPEGVSQEEFRQYLSQCRLALSLVYEDAAAVVNPAFRKTVLHLCELGDELLVNFTKDPQDMQMAQALPDRLQRLHEILVGYIDLASQKTQSPQTVRALEATEKAVTKAVAKFEEMHHRLLENDALDLSTSAKTFDNLLDFD